MSAHLEGCREINGTEGPITLWIKRDEIRITNDHGSIVLSMVDEQEIERVIERFKIALLHFEAGQE